MRKLGYAVLFSATDLVNFLECEHLSALDRINLDTPLVRAQEDEVNNLIQQHGSRHELAHLASLRSCGKTVVDVSKPGLSLEQKVEATRTALGEGHDVVFQAAMRQGQMAGFADFLERVETPSAFGDFSYEVVDTKLSRHAKAKFLIQLAFYSSILGEWQGRLPELMHVVLGNGERVSYRVADYIRYYYSLKERFLAAQASGLDATYPIPCTKCAECSWREICGERWLKDDHLSQVANIRSSQIRKLNDAGIQTLRDLGSLDGDATVAKLASRTLAVLRHQAQLQLQERDTGIRAFDLLPVVEGEERGFLRLPPPDTYDLYFDMEGDPLEKDGLEYLFGLGYREPSGFMFKPFWGHDRAQEKIAFEQFIDFVIKHLQAHPGAHIYHYAAYEKTALGRLMSLHGTREQEVDDLFRGGRLVDLYKVVREAVRVSEPGYSIKNIEHFYRDKRSGDVQNAAASIVFYERWRESKDPSLLADIEAYNRDDVESTEGLHSWLKQIRPAGMEWRALPIVEIASASDEGDEEPLAERLEKLKVELLRGTDEAAAGTESETRLRVLSSQLIDFHRREQKPQWWKIFDCLQMDLRELIEDSECLGGMWLDPATKPYAEKRSMVYTYLFPEQETKLRTGSGATRIDTGKGITLHEVDHELRTVKLKVGVKAEPPPATLSLGPGQPISDKTLRERVQEFAASVLAQDHQFKAVKRLLSKELPAVRGMETGGELIRPTDTVQEMVGVVAALDNSHIVIQGPPGAGKTYTGSKIIAELLRAGRSVGVASNSHKAIHNLLEAVVDVTRSQGIELRGFKKTSATNPESHFDSACFENSSKMEEFDPQVHQLLAGTAWAFAALPADVQLDYLFIDEAGQVSLGNLVAMGISARNIVLLGDQMQLSQPIQGTHPGRSGESVLDYLLDGRATIPAREGIFLSKTWRMHPEVCDFISQAVYDGRLRSAPVASERCLELTSNASRQLAPVGIRYVPVEHTGRSQSSEEEAGVVRALFEALLGQQFVDADAGSRRLRVEDILVVSPYNLQVNLLKRVLSDGARVGTVDKFQGQEAAVVIVSMATSSGDELPRDIEFLYSKNRLNVAISRAQCLALVVCSPNLMSVKCKTPEQMALVNTLCWVRDYSDAQTKSGTVEENRTGVVTI